MRPARRTVVPALMAIAALLLPPSANAGTVNPTVVRATARNEFYGTGNAGYFAWTQDQRRSPRARDVWARPIGGSAFQVDGGTRNLSWSGQVDQTGALLAWQTDHKGDSNVKLMDLSTQTNVPLPDRVNSANWEAYPSVFGNEFTFVRYSKSELDLWLVALDTGTRTLVTHLGPKTDFIGPPHVYGNWIVYSTYQWTTGRHWNVYRFDITTRAIVRVPHVTQMFDYAPSVDIAGNIYWVRSGNACGAQVRMYVWDGTNTALFYSVPGKNDILDTTLYDDGAGNVTLYGSLSDCTTKFYKSDIVSFANPASVLPFGTTASLDSRPDQGRGKFPLTSERSVEGEGRAGRPIAAS